MVINYHRSIIAITLAFFAVLFLNSGCSHSGLIPQSEMKQYQFKRLLLLPIKSSSDHHAKGETVICELCGVSYTTEVVEDGAAAFLTDRVKLILDDGITSVELIPDEQVQATRNRILTMKPGPKSERELLTMIGRTLNADGMLSGSVYQFRNRVGYNYGVETPAAVGFHLDLIEMESGNVIWSRRYEETQRALSENLFSFGDFFRRKGKWLTAEDLAASGMEKVLQTIPIQKAKK
ncbi:MAG: hypothetical protein V2B19_18730 [Pseudomonadota bacterium]